MTSETPRAVRAESTPAAAARGLTPGTRDRREAVPVPGCHVTLSPASLETVLEALDDAGEYRWAIDPDCTRCTAIVCDDHRADIQQGIRYAHLARRLRKAAGHD
jgi:hypothetical protein